MKQKTNFNEKGITIIALIITIILLLILVGVSINLVIKGNLFGSAEKAVDGTNAKAKQEQTRVDELMGKLNSMKDKEANDSIITEIENGKSLIYTAEEGMSAIADIIQRLHVLVLQYANQTNSESDKKALMEEIKQIVSEIDDSATTAFDGEILLNGNIARDIAVRGMFLKIDKLESEALGLNSSNIENELATTESLEAYLNKIQQARDIVSENRNRAGAVFNGLESLNDFYKEENSILASNEANLDKKLARNGLENIRNILSRSKQLAVTATESQGITDLERQSIAIEIEKLFVVIEHISENCKYNEQNLLDGTYSNISQINLTTLGGGTKLGTDVSTSEKAEALKIQYQNAVNMVENEIAKLGV